MCKCDFSKQYDDYLEECKKIPGFKFMSAIEHRDFCIARDNMMYPKGTPITEQKTLRDEFAMAALANFAKDFIDVVGEYIDDNDKINDTLPLTCYKLADAMMKAREVK